MVRIILGMLMVGLSLVACDKQAEQAHQSQLPINAEKPVVAEGVERAQKTSNAASDPSAEQQQNASNDTSAGPQIYVEGVHYARLSKPVALANPNKKEVAEVFWYGCVHCFKFDPLVKAWEKTKPANVEFVRVPAVWNERLALHAKVYYTAKKLGVLAKMHDKVFNAMNVEKKPLASEAEAADLFAANGVDRKEFLSVLDSFSVSAEVANAGAKSTAYGIEGTPEVIVNGKFRTSAKMANGQENIFKVVDYLLTVDK